MKLVWYLLLLTLVCGARAGQFVKKNVTDGNQALVPIDQTVHSELECSLLCQTSGCEMFKYLSSNNTCHVGSLPEVDMSHENPNLSEVFRIVGCSVPPKPKHGIWDCFMDIKQEKCFLHCDPGYIHKDFIGTYCVKANGKMKWDKDPKSFECVKSVAILLGGSGITDAEGAKLFSRNSVVALPNFNMRNIYQSTGAYFRSQIFSISGYSHRKLIIPYDIKTGTLTSSTQIFYYERHYSPQVIVQDNLFVIGGGGGAGNMAVIWERGDLKLNRRINIQYQGSQACAVRLTDRTYLIMGANTGYDVYETNIEDGTSLKRAGMNPRRRRFGCTSFKKNGELYVLAAGGTYGLDTSEIYRVSTGTWETAGNLNYQRTDLRLAHITAGIFAIGGVYAGMRILEVEQFHIENSSWTVAPHILPSAFEAGSLAEVPAKLFNLED